MYYVNRSLKIKKLWEVCMFIYFSMIFEVHHTIFRYDVCSEEYMDLILSLVSGTKSTNTEPMKRTERRGGKKKLKK